MESDFDKGGKEEQQLLLTPEPCGTHKSEQMLYLIDFGISTRYQDSTGKILP